MSVFAEAELHLDRLSDDRYVVDLRVRRSDSDGLRIAPRSAIAIDFDGLREASLDPAEYGRRLARIFDGTPVGEELEQARAACESGGGALKVRLLVAPTAAALAGLRWETLADPRAPDSPLFTSPGISFSRYLFSRDWRPIGPKPRRELRALLVIANPTDLGRDPALAPIDVSAVSERVAASLPGVELTKLTEPGQATVEGLLEALRRGPDLLYLVAHGALDRRGDGRLCLVDADGTAAWTSASELRSRLRDMEDLPALAVLASCQSAGTGDVPGPNDDSTRDQWEALSSLGPKLSEAGIPAVLAMQGNLSMETESLFVPRFFEALLADGIVDHAVARSRAAVRQRPDWWMPVLFTRLESGRIWYRPGFGEEGEAAEKWDAVAQSIDIARNTDLASGGFLDGGCTPIVGPGLLEPYVGRPRDLAEELGESHGYPLAESESEQLARVAQFLSVKLNDQWLRRELARLYTATLSKRHSELTAERLGAKLIEAAKRRQELSKASDGTVEGHHALVELGLPLYLTTNPDPLLGDLLREAGREPQIEVLRWNKDLAEGRRLRHFAEPLTDVAPTPERPLVFHLFGHLAEPRSLVLSEDDHFDFLAGFSRYDQKIPLVVRTALRETALLFVGFRMDDWSFRVLLRAIANREDRGLSAEATHLAAQVEPEEGRIRDPAAAKTYLRQYLERARITLYWGDPEAFLSDLLRALDGYLAGGAVL